MRALIGVAVVAGLIAAASPALAHATLVSSDPPDGAVVAAPPPQLVLVFNEPVSALVLRLIGADGSTVLINPSGRAASLVIPAPPAMVQGTHVLSWRVVSLDGHPVGGSVVFSVGAPSAGPARSESIADPAVAITLWVFKIIFYLGLFIGIGGSFCLAWLAPGGAGHGRTAIMAALAAGFFATPVLVGLQGADALGLPLSGLADRIVWRTGLETSFGTTAITATFALFAGLFACAAPLRKVARALSLFGLAAVGLALALSGHASSAEPQWLTRPAVFIHAVAIAFWLGCLVPLGAVMGSGAQGVLARFSRVIPWGIVALVASGAVLAVVQVAQPGALLTTAYGQVLCAKLCFVVVLLALAAWNRFRLTPAVLAGDGEPRRRLARSIAIELGIAAIVLGLVASWRFTPPPRVLAIAEARPAFVHIHTAQAMADVALEPGRVGSARASVVIMTGDFGGLDAKEVQLTLENKAAGIEAISRAAAKGEDAIWRVAQFPIPVGGRWEVRVEILVNDFEKITLEGRIEVRGP